MARPSAAQRSASGSLTVEATPPTALVTVMKADISGSTPLAERLDPEELRGVLGAYFAALAREIQRRHGHIDKYIGDAVVAIFGLPTPRPDDTSRAVSAALAMLEAVAVENEKLVARYGVRLSLRIGLNTQEILVPTASGDEPALVVAGDALAVAERIEASAALDTVLASDRTRRTAGRAFRFAAGPAVTVKGRADPLATHRVLERLRPARETRGAATAGTPGRGASLQVVTDRAHVLQEERKIVTVLFIDASPSETVGKQIGSAELRGVLGAYFGVVARQIQHFGGTIDKYIGDAVMAVFGAPVSHEDDAARAIGAALAVMAAVRRENMRLERDFGVTLSVRIGINTGEVVAGLLAGDVYAYTVTGDAVNTAQRIESAAPAETILVSDATRELARHQYVYEAVAPLTLKGKTRPVPAFRVIGRERRASPRPTTPLVGRESELGHLRTLFAAAATGAGVTAHVHGEPGVGKTRLIGDFLSSVPRATARLRARSASYEQETPYALVADLLRRTFGLQNADEAATAGAALTAGLAPLALPTPEASAAVLLEVLGYPATSELTPDGKRRLIVGTIRMLLRHRAQAAGLAIVLEDLHWVDRASADALAEIARAVPTFSCLLLSTSRAPSLPWTAELVALQPLASDGAAALIERLAPALEESTRAMVLERTAGNPFFIEEVVRDLVEGRAQAVPASVQDLLEARLDVLDTAPRAVAQRAAVIGRFFWTRVLDHVSEPGTTEPSLATLTEERFVEPREASPERTYAFRHGLVQEVVYRTQLIAHRRRAHVAVGDAYAVLYETRLDEMVDALAYHYERGDDDPKAVAWLSRAGDRARSLFANDEAIRSYRAALARAPDGEGPLEGGNLRERVGDVELLIGRFDDAVASFEGARSLIPFPSAPIEARLHRKIGQARRNQGRYEEALTHFDGARAALGQGDDPEYAWIELGTGNLHFRRADYEAARDHIRRGIATAERVGPENLVGEGHMLLAGIAIRVGEAREGITLYGRARAVFEKLEHLHGLASVRTNLGGALARLGRYDDARREISSALALWRRTGRPLGMAMCHNALGEIHRELGQAADAIAEYEQAIEGFREIGDEADAALAMIGLGDAHTRAGRPEEALRILGDALVKFEELGSTTYHPDLYRFLAAAELARGDVPAATAYAERALELSRSAGARNQGAITTRVLAEIALARGDVATARELVAESRRVLAELGEEGEVAKVEALAARLGA